MEEVPDKQLITKRDLYEYIKKTFDRPTDLKVFVDQEEFSVHRLVLCMGSDYCREFMRRTGEDMIRDRKPIFVYGVKKHIMCTILYYLYSGILCVRMEDYADLKMAATILRIESLHEPGYVKRRPWGELDHFSLTQRESYSDMTSSYTDDEDDLDDPGPKPKRKRRKGNEPMKMSQLKHRFFCKTCPKHFRSRLDLERHTRTHTGSKPFQCPYCPLASATKGNLKNHVFRVHVEPLKIEGLDDTDEDEEEVDDPENNSQ